MGATSFPLGESLRGHENFHHGVILELVFDRVRVVQTCRFEKFLKMVLRIPRQALEVRHDSHEILLSRVASFLVVAIVARRDSDALGAPLLPLLAALGAFPRTIDGGFGWCCSIVDGGCFHVAQDEGSPNRLLVRVVPGGDIK
jgi:hypothetical protein